MRRSRTGRPGSDGSGRRRGRRVPLQPPPSRFLLPLLAIGLMPVFGGVGSRVGAGEPEPEGPTERIEVRETADALGPDLDSTAFATVIRAEDFADRVTSLDELLRESVGVQVRSLGGEFSTVSIRGSTAEQVVVYLDGVPLNRALGGGVNLADLPLAQVETIEIYRGFTPAALSSASIGGAVVITTRDHAGRPGGTARITAGSFDSTEGVLSFTSSAGAAEYAVGLDFATSEGDFEYLDDNGTPINAADDERAPRTNNDFSRSHFSGRYTVRTGQRARITVTADLLSSERGIPGVGALRSEEARFDSSRWLLRPEIEAPGFFGGRLLLRGALDYTGYRENLDDSGADFGTTPFKTDLRIDSFGQEAGFTLVASARQAVSFLAAHRRESLDLGDLLSRPSDLWAADRDSLSLTLEDQVALAGGRLVLNPSLRYERHDSEYGVGAANGLVPATLDTFESDLNGKIGLRAQVSETVTLKGNYGRFLRVPDFIELFGNRGSVVGNPALVPESGRNLDVGFAVARRRPGERLRNLYVELSAFETVADDLIQFLPLSVGKVKGQNLGKARIRGAELSLALALGRRFSGSLNATHQRAEDISGNFADGKLLPGRPRDEVSAAAAVELGRSRLSYAFTYVGENFVDQQNTVSAAIPARYLHEIGYRISLPHGLSGEVTVKNLTDEEVYDVARFPLPGRSFFGRLTWEF